MNNEQNNIEIETLDIDDASLNPTSNDFVMQPQNTNKNNEFIKSTDDLVKAVPNPELMVSSPIDSELSTDDLIEIYVGKKYISFKKPFNFIALLVSMICGPLYYFYRKLSLVGLLLFILFSAGALSILLLNINVFVIIVFPVLFGIISGIIFNKLYLNTVKSRVIKIKNKNKSMSISDLKKLCTKKGGTNIVVAILMSLILMGGLACFIVFSNSIIGKDLKSPFINLIKKDNSEPTSQKTTEVVDKDEFNGKIEYDHSVTLEEKIDITIPFFFEASELNSDYRYSSRYISDTDNIEVCSIDFGVVKNAETSEKLINGIAKYNKSEAIEDIVSEKGYDWKTLVVEHSNSKTKYAAISIDNRIYLLQYEFKLAEKETFCNIFYEQAINSLVVK